MPPVHIGLVQWLGLSIVIIGAVFGYMYLTSLTVQGQIDTLIAMSLGKLSILAESDAVMGIILLGFVISFLGLMTRKR